MTTAGASVAPSDITSAGRRLLELPEPPLGVYQPPARARDVQLLGDLDGSGYRETPTLVRRGDGQIIKVTPLLYELIDAIDGHRGHDELAGELGRRVGRRATAENVEFLIEHKLRPLGVLRQLDGTEPEVKRSNPLLALRPRVIISKPELTRLITAPFTWLFKPLLVAPVLLGFAAISAWLLIEKGLSSALHQAFYDPALILIVWGLVLLSAGFHEVGHAAACRFGGGRPGVIGAGLYLIRPAFYTDVSDSYRLSRRARLRVDLGGLYFSAIFAVATAGVWFVSGADALLLVIAVQLIQMVQQLVPFIRADGYHILADLTGVPDLFAHIKPTLLGLLPTRSGRPENRVLKPWARAVVASWVLTTVPVLMVALGFIVLSFPRLAATGWDSMGMRWDEGATFWSTGDVPGVAVSAISIGLVALPVASIAYLVLYLGGRFGRRAWRATAGRPRHRALVILAGAALAALLTWAWWPSDDYRPISAHEEARLPTVLSERLPTILSPRSRATPPVHLVRLFTPVAVRGVRQPIAPTIYVLSRRPLPTATRVKAARMLVEAPRERAAPTGGPPTKVLPDAAGDKPAGKPAHPHQVDAPATAPPPPVGEQPWPFPFDAPEASAAGDNRAMAVNTIDGSKLWDFAFSTMLLETGQPVLQANEAHAYANCTNCLTGAAAFQLLMIVGQVNTIAPLNAAVAANYGCVRCDTYALAYQVVVSLTQAPDAEVLQQIDLAIQRLRDLEAHSGSLSGVEVMLALESAKREMLEALEGILAGYAAPFTSERVDEAVAEEAAPSLKEPDSDEASSADDTADPEQDGAEATAEETNPDSTERPGEGSDTESPPPGPVPTEDDPAADTPSKEPDGESPVDEAAPDSGATSSTCPDDDPTPGAGCPDAPAQAEDAAAEEEPAAP